MSDEKPAGDQQEPTMEEILASIRRIISDDEEAGEQQDKGEQDELEESGEEDGTVEEEAAADEDAVEEDGDETRGP